MDERGQNEINLILKYLIVVLKENRIKNFLRSMNKTIIVHTEKSIVIISLVMFVALIQGCSSEDSISINGITDTDSAGRFIGAIDTMDWSASIYGNVHFGNTFWINPGFQINIRIDTVSLTGVCAVRIYNSGTSPQTFKAAIKYPFSVAPDSIMLLPREYQDLVVTITLSSAFPNDYYDSLKITTAEGLISIPAHAYFLSENSSGPAQFVFFPAYPNPSGNIMIFQYRLPSSGSTRLYIKNKSGNTILFVNELLRTAGTFSDTLIIDKEKTEPGMYRAYLEFGRYKAHGDIYINNE